ncbi:esterase [Taylorella equigenitalis]|uniref:esterase n=1 Tax=Taylorella equigenitalis TaxID=29575 RepID=UPI00040254E0|nr:esterase [Taylorella equigenitalis]ASY30396.1 esterase [Taylorella equigenitalis]ASY40688.1 esterase [Taylorella equigenitalis]KOS58412.1 esterase [Taylorella equigenitalis]
MFPSKQLLSTPDDLEQPSQLFILGFPDLENLRMMDVVSNAYREVFPQAQIFGIGIPSEEVITETSKIEEYVRNHKVNLIETIRHIQKDTNTDAQFTALVGSGPIGSVNLSLLGLSSPIAGRVITFNSYLPIESVGNNISLDYTAHLIYTETECEFGRERIESDFKFIKDLGADITLDLLGGHEDPIDTSINRLKTCIPLKIINQINQ